MSEFSTDLEKLLAPISFERPSGESLRYEGTYDRIQESRREDDPALPQGVWKAALKQADWEEVRNLCTGALETRTKDLQIAAWLTDAWVNLHGFAGAREGLRLVLGLCEGFWETVHPEIQEDGLEYRFAPFEWINEKLALKLKRIPITQPHSGDVSPYAWEAFERAVRMESEARKDVKPVKGARAPTAEEQITLGKFRSSVMLTPKSFYIGLAGEVGGVLEAAGALEGFLKEKGGDSAPTLHLFKDVLRGVQSLVNNSLKEREGEPDGVASAGDVQAPSDAETPSSEAPTLSPGGPIRSRAEAYRRISEAADYLLMAEPHSPAPYLIKRAVSWGGMTLTELLQEFIHNNTDLQAIYALLGIRKGGEK